MQVGVLVYGINSKQSFDNLELWIEHLEEANEDFVIFLVGNKADLADQRAVPFTHGNQKKRLLKNCVRFVETSASQNLESINSLFNEIARSIVLEERYRPDRGSM